MQLAINITYLECNIIPCVLLDELLLTGILLAYKISPLLFKDMPCGLALFAGLLASLKAC